MKWEFRNVNLEFRIENVDWNKMKMNENEMKMNDSVKERLSIWKFLVCDFLWRQRVLMFVTDMLGWSFESWTDKNCCTDSDYIFMGFNVLDTQYKHKVLICIKKKDIKYVDITKVSGFEIEDYVMIMMIVFMMMMMIPWWWWFFFIFI